MDIATLDAKIAAVKQEFDSVKVQATALNETAHKIATRLEQLSGAHAVLTALKEEEEKLAEGTPPFKIVPPETETESTPNAT